MKVLAGVTTRDSKYPSFFVWVVHVMPTNGNTIPILAVNRKFAAFTVLPWYMVPKNAHHIAPIFMGPGQRWASVDTHIVLRL